VHGDLKPGNVLLKGSRVDVRGFNAQCIDFVSARVANWQRPKVQVSLLVPWWAAGQA